MIYPFVELKAVPCIINGENPQKLGILKLKQNKLSTSTSHFEKWNNDLKITVDLLNSIGVAYVLLKNIDIPFVHMNDIDFLVENNSDRALLKDVLKKKHFVVQQRGMDNSDKFTAIGNYGKSSNVEIDVYLGPTWYTIPYAPHGSISLSRVQTTKLGRKIFVPSPTHDLFILVTHSYWHSRVTLAEVAQVTKIVLSQKIEWNLLLSMAKTYRLEHPLYLYCTLVKDVFDSMHYADEGLQSCLADLKKKFLCRLIVSAVKRGNRSFPLRIPYVFKIVSSFDEIIKSFGRKRVSYKEAESYLLALLMGRKIEYV